MNLDMIGSHYTLDDDDGHRHHNLSVCLFAFLFILFLAIYQLPQKGSHEV